MQNPAIDRNRIAWSVVLYLAICFVATYALFMYVVVVPRSAWAIQIGFFFPTVAAFITLISLKLPFNELGARLPAARWFLIAWLLPIVWGLAAYLPVWLIPSLGGIANTLRHSPNSWSIALSSAGLAITLGALEGLPATAGEEFGWNGFLLPNLAKLFGPRHSIVLVGAIWTACHYPLILGPFRGFGPLWYQLVFFTLLSINTNMVYGYFRLKSGSTWPSVVAASVNGVFIYMFADRITGTTAVTPWLTGDFGIFMVVATGIAAAWCWVAAGRIAVARATG
jgi:membrane protease YdiL (CAAX protease family)